MVVNRSDNQLSFINGRMVATSVLNENELPEQRLSDWFIGGPGPFNSDQYFAGQIDELELPTMHLQRMISPKFIMEAVSWYHWDSRCTGGDR